MNHKSAVDLYGVFLNKNMCQVRHGNFSDKVQFLFLDSTGDILDPPCKGPSLQRLV